MAVSFATLSTAFSATTNQSTAYTGTAGTAFAGDILISFVSVSGNTTAGTMAGGSLTWNLLTSQTKNAGADICILYWAFVASTVSVTPSYTPSSAATGCIIDVIRVIGSTGTSSSLNLVQTTATSTGTTTNPVIAFTSTPLSTSGVLLFAANGTNSSTQWTPPTGFVELTQINYNTPANSTESTYKTTAALTTVYGWSNGNTTSWRTFGLEFAAAQATTFDPMGMMGFFGI